MTDRLLDFVVVGAQKSGTTALHHLLRSTPGVALPRDKEVPIFHRPMSPEQVATAIATIRWEPPDGAGLRGKVTPHYLGEVGAASRLHAYSPGTKILAILRDPVDRLVSQYRMNAGRGAESRSIDAAVEAALTLPRDAVELRETETYVARSSYASALRPYVDAFGADRVYVWSFDDLTAAPLAVVDDVRDVIGLPPYRADVALDVPRNEARAHRLRWLRTAATTRPARAVLGVLPARTRSALVGRAERAMYDLGAPAPPVTLTGGEVSAALAARLMPEIAAVSTLGCQLRLGLAADLERWLHQLEGGRP